eukprot:scaffold764_cov248-Pinguiococcus_pyrenoidosus.AAC.2
MIEQVGTQLQLPPRALSGAKERFAHYRDAKQHVNKRDAVIAVCILDAVHTHRMNIGFYANRKFKDPHSGLVFPTRRDLLLHLAASHADRKSQARPGSDSSDKMDPGVEKDLAMWTPADVSKWAGSVAFAKGIEVASVEGYIQTMTEKLRPRAIEEEKKNSAVTSASFLLVGQKKSPGQKTAGQRLLQSARRAADIARLLGMPAERDETQERFVKGLGDSLRDLTRRAKQLALERRRLEAEKLTYAHASRKRISAEEARDERHGIKRRKIEGAGAEREPRKPSPNGVASKAVGK